MTKVNHFKRLVKQKAIKTGINYLNSKQLKGGKGSLIKYDTLEFARLPTILCQPNIRRPKAYI